MAATITKPQESVLLKLPAELRAQIYEDILLEAKVIELTLDHLHRRFPSLPENRNCQPHSVLQTCRQIHNEASLTYYSWNRKAIPSQRNGDLKCLQQVCALDAVDTASINHIHIKTFQCRAPKNLSPLSTISTISRETTAWSFRIARCTWLSMRGWVDGVTYDTDTEISGDVPGRFQAARIP
jgi:hypothetical protein